ncbi:hypothetical protein [Salinibaculum salinum]|uniref:hypothetical protein n=1 Tax=Salinibaculum salinum TaxID=3131996 RepID=UPI0030EDCB1F
MALEKAVRGVTILAVMGLTYRMGQLVAGTGGDPDLLFVAGVILLAFLGLAGLMRDIPLVSAITGFLLFGIGFLFLTPSILVAGMALVVDGVSSGTPRLTNSAPV